MFASGIGTLIYILCTKARVPIYLGSSFTYIGYIQTARIAVELENGSESYIFGPALTGLLVVGIIYTIVAIVIKFLGTKWLEKLLPPIVVGPMIIVIGLSFAGSAISNADIVTGGDWRNIVVACVTVLLVAFIAIKGKGFLLKIIPFLLGNYWWLFSSFKFKLVGET